MKKHFWIIGASSGIGEALARNIAKDGNIVAISARNETRLNEIISSLPGSGHLAIALDVRDISSLDNAVIQVKENFKVIDNIILMTGTYESMNFLNNFDLQIANEIIDTNLKGTLNTIQTVLPILKQQGFGQIALCGSVAGYRGLPNSQPYGATKAAIASIAESLSVELADTNINVKLISPGFVKTPMTAKNTFPMPMMITAEKAAAAITAGLQSKSFEIHFPKKFTYLMKILRLLPFPLYSAIVKRVK